MRVPRWSRRDALASFQALAVVSVGAPLLVPELAVIRRSAEQLASPRMPGSPQSQSPTAEEQALVALDAALKAVSVVDSITAEDAKTLWTKVSTLHAMLAALNISGSIQSLGRDATQLVARHVDADDHLALRSLPVPFATPSSSACPRLFSRLAACVPRSSASSFRTRGSSGRCCPAVP